MAQWKNANLGSILPSAFTGLIQTASTVVSTVGGILTTLRAVLQTAKTFLVAFPIFNPAGLLQTLVDQIKASILNTGFYALMMWDYPLKQYYSSVSATTNTGLNGGSFENTFQQDVLRAFTDGADPGRPIFPAGSQCAMVVLVGGVPGLGGVSQAVAVIKDSFFWWTELQAAYAAIQKLEKQTAARLTELKIQLGEVKLLPATAPRWQHTRALMEYKRARRDMELLTAEELLAAPDPGTTPESISAWTLYIRGKIQNSSYPDWQRITLQDIIPPLPGLLNFVFDPLLALLQQGRDIVAAITAMIDLLTAKVDQLNQLIADIETYLDQIEGLISATGLYALFIETSDGTDGLMNELRQATNKPFAGLTNGFYFGVVMVAGGPTLAPFVLLFSPVGA